MTAITPGLDIAKFVRAHHVRFVRKDASRLMRVLGWLFKLVGYDFMNLAWTAIGRTVYYPVTIVNDLDGVAWSGRTDAWFEPFRPVIEHELYHVLQFKRLWHLHSVLYLLGVPLPLFFAWYRWRCERVAYLHVLRYYGALPPDAVLTVEGGKLSDEVIDDIKAAMAEADASSVKRVPVIKRLGPVLDPIQDMRVDAVVRMLWRVYGWCWPRSWMRRWLWKELGR